ncbi:ATP-dependent RNA helicase, partial [archaeon]
APQAASKTSKAPASAPPARKRARFQELESEEEEEAEEASDAAADDDELDGDEEESDDEESETDEEGEEDSDEDSDEEDSDEEDGMMNNVDDKGRIIPRSLASLLTTTKRKGVAAAAAVSSTASGAPSKFAFTVKLPTTLPPSVQLTPSGSAVPPPSQQHDGASPSGVASGEGALTAETMAREAAFPFLSKATKEDATYTKLASLRQRNEAANALGLDVVPGPFATLQLPVDTDGASASDEEADNAPIVRADGRLGLPRSVASAAASSALQATADALSTAAAAAGLSALPSGLSLMTAADVVLARERSDEVERLARRKGAQAAAELLQSSSDKADATLLRAAMWDASGTRRLATSVKLSPGSHSAFKPVALSIARPAALQAKRLDLPVCAMESDIMETVQENDIVIVCGETGSGKTTQIPQFLYEAGYARAPSHVAPLPAAASTTVSYPNALFAGVPGMIAVTQPRRVAATSTAARVAEELGVSLGAPGCPVGYQVRYETDTLSADTRIKFMTDGILLKEIQSDLLLRRYSVIILDEAHERNMNTDVLIGLLSRAVPLRNQLAKEQAEVLAAARAAGQPLPTEMPLGPLKLIVMSATLRVADFTENSKLFPLSPPVVHVTARQFPVSVHFSRRTELDDYIGETFAKIVKIHTRLPDGGILVFVTGQNEIEDIVMRLRKRFDPRRKKRRAAAALVAAAEDGTPTAGDASPAVSDEEDALGVGTKGAQAAAAGDVEAVAEDADKPEAPVHVLPLYALLPRGAQMRVFEPPPAGHRLIVVATN